MKSVELLTTALSYIEEHLKEDLRTEEVAKACYCSKSTLEKLFRYVNHLSVHDYMVRRRMTLAGRELWNNPQIGIMEVALEYGYGSNEAFTRAFRQVWNCKPSEFREKHRYSALFPRLEAPREEGDEYMKTRRHVDISELYDLFRSRKDCYFICGDIARLMPINEISHKAGDLAILEAMHRMEDAAGEEDVVFRIGGDEFVILTDSEDAAYAENVAKTIREKNGQPVLFEGREIPLSLHVGITKYEGRNIRYSELFTKLHNAIRESKPC